MRIKELLQEAPLPSDWNSEIFNERVPFKTRVEYAKARAEQVGRGSSRVAFVIPYQGRKTVLKVVLNNKGLAQNQEEAALLSDWYIQNIGNVIPLIDYDERNSRPTWIHTEYATKITQKQLERYFGNIPMYQITSYLDKMSGKSRFRGTAELPEHVLENENFQMLQDLVLNFSMPAGDLARKANWSMYKGRPVIIDLGYTDETAKLYSR